MEDWPRAVFANVEFRDRGKTNRAGRDPRDQIVAGDAGTDPVAPPNFHGGDGDTTDLMRSPNCGVADLDRARLLYAFGGVSQRQGSTAGFFRRAKEERQLAPELSAGFPPADRA